MTVMMPSSCWTIGLVLLGCCLGISGLALLSHNMHDSNLDCSCSCRHGRSQPSHLISALWLVSVAGNAGGWNVMSSVCDRIICVLTRSAYTRYFFSIPSHRKTQDEFALLSSRLLLNHFKEILSYSEYCLSAEKAELNSPI
jgi:hypothetical protein